jgi:hypothetical protein
MRQQISGMGPPLNLMEKLRDLIIYLRSTHLKQFDILSKFREPFLLGQQCFPRLNSFSEHLIKVSSNFIDPRSVSLCLFVCPFMCGFLQGCYRLFKVGYSNIQSLYISTLQSIRTLLFFRLEVSGYAASCAPRPSVFGTTTRHY